jgi:hypothetical protein
MVRKPQIATYPAKSAAELHPQEYRTAGAARDVESLAGRLAPGQVN